MAIAFWFVSAFTIAASVAVSTLQNTGLRTTLIGFFVIGLTPLGFIQGAGIPVYLAELLLAAIAGALIIRYYGQLPNVRWPSFIFVYAAFFLFQIALALLARDITLFDILRDTRPLAFVGLLLLVGVMLRQVSTSRKVTERLIAIMIFGCIGADVFYFTIAHLGLVEVGGISGEYFARTGLIRYADLMTISLFGLANYLMFSSERPAKIAFWLVVCGIITVLSLNRVFAIGFLIGICWWVGTIVRQWTRSPLIFGAAGLSPFVLLIVAGVLYTRSEPGAGEVVSRVTELFDLSLLVAALKYRFVDPAVAGGYELSLYAFFFGDGMGLKFYVPWFEYRGLDPWHFSIDSLFAFAFFKYGVAGLSVLIYAITVLLWSRPWHIANAWIWLYLLVHSGINVPSFLLFLVVLTVLKDSTWLLMVDRAMHPKLVKTNEILR